MLGYVNVVLAHKVALQCIVCTGVYYLTFITVSSCVFILRFRGKPSMPSIGIDSVIDSAYNLYFMNSLFYIRIPPHFNCFLLSGGGGGWDFCEAVE